MKRILSFLWGMMLCLYIQAQFPYGSLPEKFRNQDRQFSLRLRAIQEGQFWQHMPTVVIGGNDVLTSVGFKDQDYINSSETGNGYWNRWYLSAGIYFKIHLK